MSQRSWSSWKRAGLVCVLVAATLPGFASHAGAATVTNCEKYGQVHVNNNQYIYQNNVWNSNDPQCANVDDTTGAWSITQANFNMPTNGGPAGYPSPRPPGPGSSSRG